MQCPECGFEFDPGLVRRGHYEWLRWRRESVVAFVILVGIFVAVPLVIGVLHLIFALH
jgi:hypothetical protein